MSKLRFKDASAYVLKPFAGRTKLVRLGFLRAEVLPKRKQIVILSLILSKRGNPIFMPVFAPLRLIPDVFF